MRLAYVFSVIFVGLSMSLVLNTACEKPDNQQPPLVQSGEASNSTSSSNRQSNAAESPLKMPLQNLLDDLETIGKEHDELYDTDVRERMSEAVWRGFIKPEEGYVLPDEFGMFSANGNAAVKAALQKYIKAANEEAKQHTLRTLQERLDAFQDSTIKSSLNKNTYDEFFGHRDGG